MDLNNMYTKEQLEMMKKQWEAMGIDPNTMLNYMSNAMNTANQYMDLAQQQMGNMMGAIDPSNDPFGLMNDGPEIKEDSQLTAQELKAVACGANLAYLNLEYLNTFQTYKPEGQISAMLSNDWGIDSRKDFQETLEWLDNEGHRKHFDLIWKNLQGVQKPEWAKTLENVGRANSFGHDEIQQLNEYAVNAIQGYTLMQQAGGFKTTKEPSILTWDLGRAINLCRWGFDANYLTEDLTKKSILYLADKLYKAYDSWQSLSEGYLLGLAMWSGDEDRLQEMLDEQQILLTHEKSPWVTIKW